MTTLPNKITPWASDANYPAGAHAWSGQPTKVVPAYVEFTPSVAFAPSAQEMNDLLNARDVALNAVIDYVAQTTLLVGALNWNPSRVNLGSGADQIMCANAWDPFLRVWYSVVGDSIGTKMFSTSNGGNTWREVNPDFVTAYIPLAGCAAVNPNTGDVIVIRVDPGSGINYVSHKPAYASAWVDTAQTAIPTGGALGVCFFGQWAGGGGGDFLFVGAQTSGGAGIGAVSLTSDGHGFWSPFTLPSGWVSVTGQLAGYLYANKSDGTQTVVAMCGLTPGSADRSRLLSLPSNTDITPSILAAGGLHIRGLCYSSQLGLWAIAVVDSAINTIVYTSPDLVTWTSRSAMTNTSCAGIASIGNLFALYAFNPDLPHVNRVLVTADIMAGPAVWEPADFDDVTPLTSRQLKIGTFLSNGEQILAAELFNSQSPLAPNTGSVTISQRVSSLAG